jgi:hypothetical protein
MSIDGSPVDLTLHPLISRYVVWSDVTPLVAQELVAPEQDHARHLLIGNLESVVPASVALPTRIALREFLTATDTGREFSIHKDTQPLWLVSCNQTSIAELGFSLRSINRLEAASVATLNDLLSWTPRRLMRLKHFGEKCFDEVTGVLRSLGYVSLGFDSPFFNGSPRPRPSGDGCPFACLLSVEEALPERVLRNKLGKCGWKTVGEIARHSLPEASRIAKLTQKERETLENLTVNLSLTFPVPQPDWAAAHVPDLRRVFSSELAALGLAIDVNDKCPANVAFVFKPSADSLNTEVEQLIPAEYDQRKRAVISALFGLEGQDPLTLEEVSKSQTPPMSRERIRQIGSPFVDELISGRRNLIWLRRALSLLTEEAPCTLGHAETSLVARGILTSRLSVAAILKLVERAGLTHSLTIELGLLLPGEVPLLLQAVVQRARKDCGRWGVADWKEVGSPLVPFERVLRPVLPYATWLGGSERYFVFAESKNSLANRLSRMLHVSPRIPIAAAYDGVFRDPKVKSTRLPRELFSAFCDLWPWCRIDEEEIVRFGKLPPLHVSGDDQLVVLMRRFGRPVTRREIMRRARQEGIGGQTIWQALQYSNVLTEADGLYSVIGDTEAGASARLTMRSGALQQERR